MQSAASIATDPWNGTVFPAAFASMRGCCSPEASHRWRSNSSPASLSLGASGYLALQRCTHPPSPVTLQTLSLTAGRESTALTAAPSQRTPEPDQATWSNNSAISLLPLLHFHQQPWYRKRPGCYRHEAGFPVGAGAMATTYLLLHLHWNPPGFVPGVNLTQIIILS